MHHLPGPQINPVESPREYYPQITPLARRSLRLGEQITRIKKLAVELLGAKRLLKAEGSMLKAIKIICIR